MDARLGRDLFEVGPGEAHNQDPATRVFCDAPVGVPVFMGGTASHTVRSAPAIASGLGEAAGGHERASLKVRGTSTHT